MEFNLLNSLKDFVATYGWILLQLMDGVNGKDGN